jgi:hypothetical protein
MSALLVERTKSRRSGTTPTPEMRMGRYRAEFGRNNLERCFAKAAVGLFVGNFYRRRTDDDHARCCSRRFLYWTGPCQRRVPSAIEGDRGLRPDVDAALSSQHREKRYQGDQIRPELKEDGVWC